MEVAMTEQELETQCMKLINTIDTEVVAGDPVGIPSFDEGTLYVWLIPGPPKTDADGLQHTNMVRGRLGQRDETASTVVELAGKLGIEA
jgi:hypothetical protein